MLRASCSRLVSFFFNLALCNSTHQVYPAKDNKPRRVVSAFMWTSTSGSEPRQQTTTGWHTRVSLSVSRSLRLWSNCIFPSQWNAIIHEEKATRWYNESLCVRWQSSWFDKTLNRFWSVIFCLCSVKKCCFVHYYFDGMFYMITY